MSSEDPFAAFAKTGGWDALQGPPAPSPEEQAAAAQATYELDAAIHRAFSTPDGRVVLEWLENLAIRGRRFDPMFSKDGLTTAFAGFFREGQAALYFEIENRMARAEQGPPHVAKQEGVNKARASNRRKGQ